MKRELIAITILLVAGVFSGGLREGLAVTTDMLPDNDGMIDFFYIGMGSYSVDTTDMWFAASHREYPANPPGSFKRRAVLKFDISALSIPDVEEARLWISAAGINAMTPYVIVEWVEARNTSAIAADDWGSTVIGRVGVLNALPAAGAPQTSGTGYWETITIDPGVGPDPFISPHTDWGVVQDLDDPVSRAVYMYNSPYVIRADYSGGLYTYVQSAQLIIPLDSASTNDPMKPLPGVRAYAVELTDKSGLGANITADDWDSPEHGDLGMFVPPDDQPGGGTEYSIDVTDSMNEFVENATLGAMFGARLKMEGENGDSQDTTVDWAYYFKDDEVSGYDSRIDCLIGSTNADGSIDYSIDVTEELQAAINAGHTYFSLRLRLATDPNVGFGVTTNYNWYYHSVDRFFVPAEQPKIRYGDAYVPTPVASTPATASVLQWESEHGALYQIYCKDSLDDAVPWKKTGPEYVGTGGVISGVDKGDAGTGVLNPSDPSVTERYYSIVKTIEEL